MNCAHLRCDWLLLQVLEYPESDTFAFFTDTSILYFLQNTILPRKKNKNKKCPKLPPLSPRTRTCVKFDTHLFLTNSITDLIREIDENEENSVFANVLFKHRVTVRSLTFAGFHARTDSPARFSRPRLNPLCDKSAARSETRERETSRARLAAATYIEITVSPSIRIITTITGDQNRATRLYVASTIYPPLDFLHFRIFERRKNEFLISDRWNSEGRNIKYSATKLSIFC